MLVQVGLSVLVNHVLFPNRVFLPVSSATHGIVSQTLCANMLMMAVNIGIVIVLIGRLRPRDIGLVPTRRALVWSIAAAGGLWACASLAIAFASMTRGEPVLFASSWTTADRATTALGQLCGQVFGNALYEESLFRGFLLVQIGLLLARDTTASAHADPPRADPPRADPPRGRVLRWTAAALVSQTFFAITHIPNRLMKGTYASLGDVVTDQGTLVLAGLVYAVIYLGTRNLWLCVLLHALANAPTPLLASSDGASAGSNVIVIGHVIVLVVAAVMLVRRRSSPSTPAFPV